MEDDEIHVPSINAAVAARSRLPDSIRSYYHVHLSGAEWEDEDIAPTELRSDREAVLDALEGNRLINVIGIDHHFLKTMTTLEQGRLFRIIGRIPGLQRLSIHGLCALPGIINTGALLESLRTNAWEDLRNITICNFILKNRSEVKQLADIFCVCMRHDYVSKVMLENIHVPAIGDMEGFLDPIVNEGIHTFHKFHLSCCDAPSGLSLVSTEALSRLCRNPFLGNQGWELEGLGLTDAHCKIISERAFPLSSLSLRSNPRIGQEGYEALLGLMNRSDFYHRIVVDDSTWEATFKLVSLMKSKGRIEYMEDGVFISKSKWVDWISQVATMKTSSLVISDLWSNIIYPQLDLLNMIWYTLREKPDWIQA
jgi:hypothetical protein